MCKPTLVTVPLVLLLLDYWPLRRLTAATALSRRADAKGAPRHSEAATVARLVVEKIPLFAPSAAGAGATLWAHEKSIIPIEQIPFVWRVGNGLVTCLTYIKQMIWPAR